MHPSLSLLYLYMHITFITVFNICTNICILHLLQFSYVYRGFFISLWSFLLFIKFSYIYHKLFGAEIDNYSCLANRIAYIFKIIPTTYNLGQHGWDM